MLGPYLVLCGCVLLGVALLMRLGSTQADVERDVSLFAVPSLLWLPGAVYAGAALVVVGVTISADSVLPLPAALVVGAGVLWLTARPACRRRLRRWSGLGTRPPRDYRPRHARR